MVRITINITQEQYDQLNSLDQKNVSANIRDAITEYLARFQQQPTQSISERNNNG